MDAEAMFHRLDNLIVQPTSFAILNSGLKYDIRPFNRFLVTYALLKKV